MPCYEPPPAWSGEQRDNAQKAVPLLCDQVTGLLRTGLPIDRRHLVWYIEHTQLDIKVATHNYYGGPLPPHEIDQQRVAQLRDRLSMAEHRLATML